MIRLLFAALVLSVPALAQGGETPSGGQEVDAPPAPEAVLDAALAAPGSGPPDALHAAFAGRDGDLAQAYALLDPKVEEGVAEAQRLRAWLRWRDGNLEGALEDFEALAGGATSGEAALSVARLLDATGEAEKALEAYRALADASAGGEDEQWLRLRMALMEMELGSDEAQGALAEFAARAGSDPELRNRAAIVLALLGRPADAIELYAVPSDPKGAFRGELRVSEWALRAEQYEVAQASAWRAVQAAKLGRDRRYALAVLLEAHRADESEARLVERFAQAESLTDDERTTWIALLRETDRYGEAIELFAGSGADEFSAEQRLELLEMYRQAGREDEMLAAYARLIDDEPGRTSWRMGLARFYLERGEPAQARATWDEWLAADGAGGDLLDGAAVLSDLGLDDLAKAAAERALELGEAPEGALLFLFELERNAGELVSAAAVLERLDSVSAADSPVRYPLSEAWEQLGDPARAAETLEKVVDARGLEEAGEDVAMRLAWLYSELGDEDRALDAWSSLAERVKSVPRLRYVEDRLMTVASRLGRLADIAVDLETKLASGEADEREANLLVRLYTKVGDAVSAAEVIDEFLKSSGKSEVEALEEKARVYLACTDYYYYERTVRKLMEVDPEGEADHLQQLAMSQLERGKPDEARETLAKLEGLGDSGVGPEFEAGVLSLAGMREEAAQAYRRGLAVHPERIDSYLLMANLYRELGRASEAVGMFQYLAEVTDKDDLFTVSVDGLLNQLVDAPPRPEMLAWARRQALERLAQRSDKPYLYQLLADLAEEANDKEAQLDALEYSLSIAATRRGSVLRELMDLSKANTDPFGGSAGGGDVERQLAFGRRLVGLAELVPPDVFLDLGEAFLEGKDVSSAVKTFDMARDLPDPVAFRRQTAALLETSGFEPAALEAYAKVLATRPTDAGLLVKVAEMEEQLAQDQRARPLYAKALDLVLARKPLVLTDVEEEDKKEEPAANRFFSFSRNVDDFDRFHVRALTGWLATSSDTERAASDLEEWRRRTMLELDTATIETKGIHTTLERYPRVEARAKLHRRLALSLGLIEGADQLDAELMRRLPEDEDLIEAAVDDRVRRGLTRSAQGLIESAELEPERRADLLARAGRSSGETGGAARLPLSEALRRLLPLAAAGDTEGLALLLRRIDLAGMDADQLSEMAALYSGARWTGKDDLILFIAREWVRQAFAQGQASYQLETTLGTCAAGLTKEGKRSLYQYFVGIVLEDKEKGSEFVSMLAELSNQVGGDLLTSDQVSELLDGYGERYAYGLGPVLSLLEPAARASALRTLWPKIEKTRRASFLVDLVGEMREGTGDELGAFITEAFGDALGEADQFFSYSVGELADVESNFEVVLKMVDALEERTPGDPKHSAIRAISLNGLERSDEALALALPAWVDLTLVVDGDYSITRCKNGLEKFLLPDHGPALLAAADRAMEEEPIESLAIARIRLAQRIENPELAIAAAEDALRLFEDKPDVLDTVRSTFSSQGQAARSMELLARMVKIEDDVEEDQRKRWFRSLESSWRRYENWPEAWKVVQRIEELGFVEESSGNIPGFPAGFVLPPGSMIVVNGVLMRAGDFEEKGLPKSIAKVKEFLGKGEIEDARATLRRLWRGFKAGEATDPYGFGFGGGSLMDNLEWPEDEDEDEETDPEAVAEAERRARGGLDAYREDKPEPKAKSKSAYERLAEQPAMVAEMRRFLRTRTGVQLGRLQGLFEGLLAAQVAETGVEETLAALLAEARTGAGGKAEAAMLLAHLDAHPELLGAEVEEHLAGLVRGVDPKDAAQVRRLARVWARAGRTEDALRLYRWCATRVEGSSRFYFGGDGGNSVTASSLVEEAKEVFEGDERLALVEDILRFAKPSEEPWSRGAFDNLVLDTWRDMVGSREALARARAIAERSIDLGQGLRRETARRAAGLFAANGEVESALRALEIGLCELPPEGIAQPVERWYRIDPSRPGSLTTDDLRRLFPSDMADWEDPVGWLRAVAAALPEWSASDRVPVQRTVLAQVLVALRLHGLGEVEEARAIVAALAPVARDKRTGELWVADAAARMGDTELQLEIESGMLASQRLPVPRMEGIVRQLRTERGLEEAMEAGFGALELTRSVSLLEALVEYAAEEQNEFALARAKADLAEALAAKEALDAYEAKDEEEEVIEAELIR